MDFFFWYFFLPTIHPAFTRHVLFLFLVILLGQNLRLLTIVWNSLTRIATLPGLLDIWKSQTHQLNSAAHLRNVWCYCEVLGLLCMCRTANTTSPEGCSYTMQRICKSLVRLLSGKLGQEKNTHEKLPQRKASAGS